MGRGWSLSLGVWLWVCRRQGRAGVSLHQWDLWHGLDPNPPALCQAVPGHRLESPGAGTAPAGTFWRGRAWNKPHQLLHPQPP